MIASVRPSRLRAPPTPARRAARPACPAPSGLRAARRGRGPARAAAARAGCRASVPGTRRESARPPGSSRRATARRCAFNCGRCRGEIASSIDSAPTASTRASRTKSIRPRQQLGGLNPLAGALLEQPKRRGRIVIGEGLDHLQQPFVARRPEQAHGPPRPSTAGCRRPGADPGATAHRAASRRRGGRRPAAPRARLRPAPGGRSRPGSSAITSGVMPAKSYRWHRDSTVIGILFGLGGGEEELDVRRRLFQRLQQGVEGPGREHVHFVDVVDLEPSPAGPQRGVLPQLAHLLDAVVAGTVDLDDVDVLPERRSTGRCRRSGTVPRSAPSHSSDTWRRSGPSRSCRPRACRRTGTPGRSGSAGSRSARPGRHGLARPRPRTAAAGSAGRRPCTTTRCAPTAATGPRRPPASPDCRIRAGTLAPSWPASSCANPVAVKNRPRPQSAAARHDDSLACRVSRVSSPATPRRGRGEPGRFSQAHEGVAYGCCVPALTRFTNPHCPGPPRLTLTPAATA